MRKRVFFAAGYTSRFFGPGSPDFHPTKRMKSFEEYLLEVGEGTSAQLQNSEFDEGVLGSFMSSAFVNQGNLPGLLPFMVENLRGKPGTGVEGACGTGGRALAMGVHSVLADRADAVYVAGFEVQNTVKSVYGADHLAKAAYYKEERKKGHAYFFPAIFDKRAKAYFQAYGETEAREAMAAWYERMITCARKNPKAQEYTNQTEDLFACAMTPPDPNRFLTHLNVYHCSKISDGAASIGVFSKEGLERAGIPLEEAVELVGMGAATEDLTQPPRDFTRLLTTEIAAKRAFEESGIDAGEIGILEIHDCFAITVLLVFEALGLAKRGEGGAYLQDEKKIPTNLSGGLIGFGHPTGASGVRQMVDLLQQLNGKAANQAVLHSPYGLMVSMGGNDKTVTALIVKRSES